KPFNVSEFCFGQPHRLNHRPTPALASGMPSSGDGNSGPIKPTPPNMRRDPSDSALVNRVHRDPAFPGRRTAPQPAALSILGDDLEDLTCMSGQLGRIVGDLHSRRAIGRL